MNRHIASIDENNPLWTAEEAERGVVGELKGNKDWKALGVAIDSREVRRGDLFIALQGAASDGHRYIEKALKAGAAAVMSGYSIKKLQEDFELKELADDSPILQVRDTLGGLRALARAARRRAEDMLSVGVTGSVGKTSTKEMLTLMLAAQEDGAGRVHAPVKSFNNHVGVPLTLARAPRTTRYGVFEIGMSAPGEITPLTELVQPNVALITAVETVHLAGFADGVQGVAAAKAEIFKGLLPGGVAIVRRDEHTDFLTAKAKEAGAQRVIDFGVDAVSARINEIEIYNQTTFADALIHGKRVRYEIAAPGRHFAINALGALAVVDVLGGDLEAAARGLSTWSAVSGRGDRARLRAKGGGVFTLVDESYNANPASMRAAIETFAAAPVDRKLDGSPGKRILFLTDMLELGPTSARFHEELAEAAGIEHIDQVHAAGRDMRALMNALPEQQRGVWLEDAEALAERAPDMLEAGDAVMVKGSLGSRAQAIAKTLRALGGV